MRGWREESLECGSRPYPAAWLARLAGLLKAAQSSLPPMDTSPTLPPIPCCCLAGQQACRPAQSSLPPMDISPTLHPIAAAWLASRPAQSRSKQPPMDLTPTLPPIGSCLNWKAIPAAWLGSRPAKSRSKQPSRMHGSISLPQSHPHSLLHSLNPVYMNALPPGGHL